MPEDLPRRNLLRLAGASAAGAAGLGLAACAGKGPAQQALPTADVSHGYITRPDLTPPAITVTRHGLGADSRYIFLDAPYSGPGHGGALILDDRGDVVWFSPSTPAEHKLELNTQTYQGKPVLTWFQGLVTEGYGQGVAVIADSSYKVRHVIHAANGLLADFHEFALTPQGTALITAYRKHPGKDLSSVGGPANGVLVSGVAQEIDVATGKLLFEWDSIDHVPITETQQKPTGGDGGHGTAASPFNYFHINSITVDNDGDLLISSRNTWTIYKVKRDHAGTVVWRMGGKKSDFSMGPRTRFFWQHHVRQHPSGVLTLFDNGDAPQEEKRSRALILDVNYQRKHVTLRKAYTHPGVLLLANAMGSAQLLPDGRMFVGWGTEPYFSEFAADGRLLLDGAIIKGAPSYRAFTDDWTGHPADRPAAAARQHGHGATVYVSWNGATEVKRWTVYAGKSAKSLAEVGSAAKNGFETAIAVRDKGPYFAVGARDARGATLARSPVVRIR